MSYFNPSVDVGQLAADKRDEYSSAAPFPHICVDNLFRAETLDNVLHEFPELGTDAIQYRDVNQVKRASRGEERFGETTKSFLHFLNSQPFLEFLSGLTGVPALIPDPYFDGAGVHEIARGGYLKIHADFNKHKLTKLDRRLNVLIYLNKDWEESWGGHLELWDQDMKSCVERVLPVFNRMVVFTTTDFSYHGHPEPLRCPTDRFRRSIALYYYTNGRPEAEIKAAQEAHSTLFQPRPSSDKSVRMRQFAKSAAASITPPVVSKVTATLRRHLRRSVR